MYPLYSTLSHSLSDSSRFWTESTIDYETILFVFLNYQKKSRYGSKVCLLALCLSSFIYTTKRISNDYVTRKEESFFFSWALIAVSFISFKIIFHSIFLSFCKQTVISASSPARYYASYNHNFYRSHSYSLIWLYY